MPIGKISIIIPTLNEEQTIEKVIDEIPDEVLLASGYRVEMLLADGNSTDRTRQIAEAKGVSIVLEPRRGKGIAVRRAFKSVDADLVFMMDGDCTYSLTHIPDMVVALASDDAVIGSRLRGQREEGSMGLLNLLGNRFLSVFASVLYQHRISDLCTGYWGFRAEVLKNLELKAVGFELEAELFSQLARRGYTIAEIPIQYRRRLTRSKLRALRDGTRIGWTLLAGRFRKLSERGKTG